MIHSKTPIAIVLLFILALGAIRLAGCHTTRAASTPSSGKPASASPAQPSQPGAASKHPPRDSSVFALYHNPTYGVSFRFPRNYAIEEQLEPGDSSPDDSSLVRKQQELAAAQPGSTLVVSVVVPDDAYPNTTFSEGFLQLAINPSVSQPACRSFAAPSDGHTRTGKTIVDGIPFYWREHDSAGSGTARTLRDYAGFSSGACYEFFLEVASTANAANDAPSSRPDVMKVLRPLEKIVSSLQIRPASAPPAPAAPPASPAAPNLPVVHSFLVAPLSHPDLAGVYRASWRIADAPDNDVFISVACSPAVGVYRLSDPASRAGFPCGIFTPAAPRSGSLDFQIENRAPRDVPVTVTLFVLSLGYGTRTVTVPPSQPSISD
jgi:hypothetical protein